VFGINSELPYQERLGQIKRNRVALWNVLEICDRAESQDSKISQEAPDDFHELFGDHANLRYVFFNGKRRPNFSRSMSTSNCFMLRVLSSHPRAANAKSLDEKMVSWAIIKDFTAYFQCGSEMVVPIIYGHPAEEDFMAAQNEGFRLDGCIVAPIRQIWPATTAATSGGRLGSTNFMNDLTSYTGATAAVVKGKESAVPGMDGAAIANLWLSVYVS
jgi:hypoxanthine-DNA glycosylase